MLHATKYQTPHSTLNIDLGSAVSRCLLREVAFKVKGSFRIKNDKARIHIYISINTNVAPAVIITHLSVTVKDVPLTIPL